MLCSTCDKNLLNTDNVSEEELIDTLTKDKDTCLVINRLNPMFNFLYRKGLMAVYCEFISLIILRDSIDKYFPGGWTRFVIELPNRSMATDGEVVRVGFMNPIDSSIYLDFLIDEGLQFKQSGDREIDDISDLDQFNGHFDKRSWLEFGYRIFDERKYFCC